MRENQCHYCCRFADDLRDVELRPDGETWAKCYASRICGECRKYLNQSRQFRYPVNNNLPQLALTML